MYLKFTQASYLKAQKIIFLIFTLSLFILPTAYNQSPGMVDESFGTGGKVIRDFSGGDDRCYAIAVQRDGKIIAAGVSVVNGTQVFSLMRSLPNGDIDNSFGVEGYAAIDLPGNAELIHSIKILDNGKILVAGIYTAGVFNFGIARYNENGTLDTSFGNGNGYNFFNFGTEDDVINDMELTPDGKILVAGYSTTNGIRKFAAARYLEDGTLDSTFGENGTITSVLYGSSIARAIEVLPNGKFILAGSQSFDGADNVQLEKYNEDGTLDISFGFEGSVLFGNGFSHIVNDIVTQQNGKIIAGGTYEGNFSDTNHFFLFRLDENGIIDTSFGNTGWVFTDVWSIIGLEDLKTLLIQNDDKIIAAGFRTNLSQSVIDFAVFRYNPDGSLDNSFGENESGRVTLDIFQNNEDKAFAACLQKDGNILLGGYTIQNGQQDFAIARFLNNPPNDQPCFATELEVGVTAGSFSNALAVVETNDPNIVPTTGDCTTSWCEQDLVIQNSVWFKFVAPSDDTYSVSTCDLADFDTQIALYEFSNCNDYLNAVLLAANDDGPANCSDYDSYMEVNNLVAGRTYHILVDGYNGASGNFEILVNGLSTAIEEVEIASDLKVFPNPSTGILNVNLDLEENEKITLQLRNSVGQIIDSQFHNGLQINTSFSLESYPSGVYYLTVLGEESRYTEKVVLVK